MGAWLQQREEQLRQEEEDFHTRQRALMLCNKIKTRFSETGDKTIAASSAATSQQESLVQQDEKRCDNALEDQFYKCKLCHYVNDTNSDLEWARLSPRDHKSSAEA